MSYVVFALKWRPQNFDGIIGQSHIVNTLKSALQKDRLAHAYLFSGPRGVGKTSTARILAKALNCKDGPTVSPCGICSSCLQITQGNSLDVIEVDGASNTGVDEIRQLRESVKFSPAVSKFKIYIIDEVHMLSSGAFNALLKTLEEPPLFVKFIFATTHPEKIPTTVLSRCQRLDFRRISVMEIITQLEKIARAENINVDKEVLFAIARSSDGSLRDAESIFDQLVSFSKGKVSLEDVNSVFGLIAQDVLFDITDRIIKKDSKGALGLLNKIIDEGKDTAVFLTDLTEHFRNLMVAKVSYADPSLIDLPKDICDRLLTQAEVFALDEIFTAFNILVSTREMSKRLESARIALEIAIVKLAQDKRAAAPGQYVVKNIPQEKTQVLKEKPAVAPPEKNNIAEADLDPQQQSISIEQIRQSWLVIIDSLSRVRMSLATYLNEGSPASLENNTLTVAFPKNYSLHKESLETRENLAILEKVISEVFQNVKLRINFTLTKEEASRDESDSPAIKNALKMFGGRVIK